MKVIDKKNDRYERIITFLKENNNSSTMKELAAHLKVSVMTIYRDVGELCDMDVLHQIYGGVILNQDYLGGVSSFTDFYSVKGSEDIHRDEKERIALKALTLVESDDVLLIDSGSTTEKFARILPLNIPLTVLCHATNILNLVQQKANCRIILAGGYYHTATQCFESPEGFGVDKKSKNVQGLYIS